MVAEGKLGGRPWLEATTTGLTILTCLVVLGFTASLWHERHTRRNSTSDAVTPAGQILPSSSDFDFRSFPLTVLVGLSSTCRYCEESMPELLKLNEMALAQKTKFTVVGVGVEPPDVLSSYVSDRDLSAFRTLPVDRDHPLGRIAARTPSIVTADSSGVVRASWAGLMTAERMRQVFKELGPD